MIETIAGVDKDVFVGNVQSDLEPKTFIQKISTQILLANEYKKSNYIHASLILPLCKMMAHSFFDCEDFRVMEVKDDLYSVLKHTDNKLFYRHCPYGSFFINREFRYKDLIAKGVLVIDLDQEKHLDVSKQKDLYIAFLAIDKDFPNSEYSSYFKLSEIDVKITGETMSKSEEHNLNMLQHNISIFVVSLIDFINSEKEVEYIIQHYHEQNKKRKLKGKTRIPTTVYIKLHSTLQLYAEDFHQKTMLKYSHKFIVRGHFKHLLSKIYKQARGRKIWIRPFWKGEGIKIKKNVVIEK